MGGSFEVDRCLEATFIGFLSSVSLMIGSALGLTWAPGHHISGSFAAFGAGALIAALSVELIAPLAENATSEHTEDTAAAKLDLGVTLIMCIVGGLFFVVLDQLVSRNGGFLKKYATTMSYYANKASRKMEMLQALVESDLFGMVAAEELDHFVTYCSPTYFSVGEEMFKRGDAASKMYFVKSGCVEIARAVANQGKTCFVGQGGLMGEVAILSGGNQIGTAIVREAVHALVLHKEHALEVMENCPGIANAVQAYSAQKVKSILGLEKADLQSTHESLQRAPSLTVGLGKELAAAAVAPSSELKVEEKKPPSPPIGSARKYEQDNVAASNGIASGGSSLNNSFSRLPNGAPPEGVVEETLLEEKSAEDLEYIELSTASQDMKDKEKKSEAGPVMENHPGGPMPREFLPGAPGPHVYRVDGLHSMPEDEVSPREPAPPTSPGGTPKIRTKMLRSSRNNRVCQSIVVAENLEDVIEHKLLKRGNGTSSSTMVGPTIVRNTRSTEAKGRASAFAGHEGHRNNSSTTFYTGDQMEGGGVAPLAVWLGILLDGIPESLVIGMHYSHAVGEDEDAKLSSLIPFTLIAGLFLSNFPESLSSSIGMHEYGWSKMRVLLMWTSLTVLTSLGAGLGYALGNTFSTSMIGGVQGLAAGAMLTMIVAAMLPEALHSCGENKTGCLVLLGFVCAIAFKLLE